MADIVLRAGKGSPLTNAEVDANFTNLNAAVVAAAGTASWASITGKPATLAGYGITDAQPLLVSGTSIKTVNGQSVLGSGNIQIDGGVTSFNTRTGAITLSSGDVTGALGFTPYNSSNPSGYITSAALNSYLPLSGGTLTGELYTPTLTAGGLGRSASHTIGANLGSGAISWNNAQLEIKNSDAGSVGLALHRAGYTSNSISVTDGNGIRIDGSIALHAGNYNSYALPLSGGMMSGLIGHIRGSHNYFERSAGVAVGALGWHTDDVFYVAGHPSYGSGAGNDVRIYGFGQALRFGNATNGDVASIATNGQFQIARRLGLATIQGVTGSSGSDGQMVIDSASGQTLYLNHYNSGVVVAEGGNRVLNAANYNNYSPSLTGSGASGTWGINVSGNAATAGSATNALRLVFNDGPRNLSDRLPNSFARTVNFDFVGAGVGNGSGNYAGVMTFAPWTGTTASTGDSSYQLAFANASGVNASGQPKLSIRNGIDDTWNDWYTLLHSGNYNSYAPTLTGGGASGTWGINVTGNSGTTTVLRSSYAGDAGDLNTAGTGIIYNYSTIGAWTNAPSGMSYGSVYHLGGSAGGGTLSLQIAADINHNSTSSTKQLWFRTSNNLGFQNDWKELLHSGNYSSYALPLSGGTVSGYTTFSADVNMTSTNSYLPGHFFTNTWDGTNVYFHVGGSGSTTNKVLNLRVMNNSGGNSLYQFDVNRLDAPNLQINGNQVLHAGNYSSYALPLSGGTVTGRVVLTNDGQGFGSESLHVKGDIRAQRGTSGTGVIYFGSSTGTYLYYDGSNYHMPTGQLDVGGNRVLTAGNYTSYAPSLSGDYVNMNVGGLYSRYSYQGGEISDATTAYTLSPNYGTTTVAMHGSHGYLGGYATTLTMSGYERYGATQISAKYNATTPALAIRNYNQDVGGWNSWVGIISTANYSSYALPLSGGTITGATWSNTTGGDFVVSNSNTVGASATLRPTNSASYSAGWSVYAGASGAAIGDGSIGFWNHTAQTARFYVTQAGAGYFAGSLALTVGNKDSYTYPPASHTHDYLPLSGGTLTGTLVYTDMLYSADQTYGLFGRTAYFDTVNGRGSDPLELNYYDGGPVKIGSGTYGSKALFASGIYDSGNQVLHAANYGSYALPLSGGTVSGSTTFNSSVLVNGRDIRPYDNDSFKEFYVGGDANTYYPVRFDVYAFFHFARWSISRGYGDTAPWDPIGTGAHKGGLTLTWEWSGDGAWGGNDKTIRVIQFAEQYTTMVGGMALSVNGFIVWLRGGNAYYRFHGPGGTMNGVTPYYSTFTASNGGTYSPRSYDGGTVSAEVTNRMPVRGVSELYDGGNRVIHLGNYGSYALPLSGGTVSGNLGLGVSPDTRLSVNGDAHISNVLHMGGTAGSYTSWGSRDYTTSGSRYINANYFEVNNYGYGSTWSFAVDGSSSRYNGNVLLHAGNYSSYALPLSGGTMSGTLSFQQPVGLGFANGQYIKDNGSGGLIISSGAAINLNGTFVSASGNAIKQGNNLARPLASWGAGGASTGMVIFKLPGSSGNYGMLHMVFDIYEYNSNTVSTVIVGGHNWGSSWYNTGANVVGQLGKQVRLGYKDGQYCVVFGDSGSVWEYGQIVLRKIQNGAYYDNIMDLGAAVSVEFTATESFSNIGGDLRALRTPASFNAGGAITQAGNQVLHAGNYSSYALPLSGGVSLSGSFGLNDSKLYLRTNGDTNHYLWNADDDWEELVAYWGTGFRVKSSLGTTLLTVSTNSLSSGVETVSFTATTATSSTTTGALVVSGGVGIGSSVNVGGNATINGLVTTLGNAVLHAGNYGSYALPLSGGTVTGVAYFRSNLGGYSGSLSSPPLQAYSDSNNSAFMSFHKGGYYAVNFGLDADNVLRIGGWSASANRWQLDMSGNGTYAGNVTAYSDESLKKDWAPVATDFVARLAELKHGTYTRIDSGERQAGASAQDWQKLLPEVVNAGADGILSLAYGNAAVVSAIELAKKVVEQDERIKRLEALVEKLIGD